MNEPRTKDICQFSRQLNNNRKNEAVTNQPLPIIFSIPHGGLEIPPELEGNLAVSDIDLFNDCDLWIDDICKIDVLARVSTPYSRGLIDLNRAPDDIQSPDGAIKLESGYGKTVHKHALDMNEKRALIDKYWQPYHTELAAAIDKYGKEAKLFLDCHNMAQRSPDSHRDAGKQRPLILLANLGNRHGVPKGSLGYTSASADYMQHAMALAADVFDDITLLEPPAGEQPDLVAINRPYSGGYILKEYAKRQRDESLPPGIMIEYNRGLFVGDQRADTPIAPPNTERIELLRTLTREWLTHLVEGAQAA